MSITLTAAQKQWNDENKALIKLVKMTMAAANLTQKQYAKKLGITGRTLYNRMANPGDIRQIERQTILYLAEIYGIPITA